MRYVSLMILLSLILGFTPHPVVSNPEPITIAFIDVGQGDATLIRDGAGFDVLVEL